MCSIVVGSIPTAGFTCYHCKQFVPADQWHTCPVQVNGVTNGHICTRCGAFVLNHAFHSCGGSAPPALPTARQLTTIVTALRTYQDTPSLLPPIRALIADALDWAERTQAMR